ASAYTLTAPATPASYTLSLHDALPIFDDTNQGENAWPKRFVLVADELSATTLAELPQDRLAGIVVRDGAANSHAAIMVRALGIRSEEHTSELQSRENLVCRLLLEKKNT